MKFRYKYILAGLFVLAWILIAWLYFCENLRIPTNEKINHQNVNKLVEWLAFGYISSYIFFYVVVLIKEKQDKKIIRPVIADYTYMMLNNIMLFSHEMRKWAKIEQVEYEMTINNRNLKVYPTRDEIPVACGKIKPDMDTRESTGIATLSINPTFFEIMKNYSYHVDQHLNTVLGLSNHLDLSLLKLLMTLKVSKYHSEMISKLMVRNKLGAETLHSFSKGFKEYFQTVLEIEKYAEKELKSYVERPALKGRME